MPESGTNEPRLLTEDEAYAIAAAEVKREVAQSQEKISELEASLNEKSNEIDASAVREQALKDELEAATKALEDFKAEIVQEREKAERTGARLSRLREVAQSMPDEFFEEESRVSRVIAMSDEDFESYCSDLADVSKAVSASSPAPRESAMGNTQQVKKSGSDSVLGKYVAATVGA